MENNKKFYFRKARKDDLKAVIQMIQELADFEKMSNGPTLTEDDLLRDSGLNGNPEYCHIYVLDLAGGDKSTTIGYAICFYAYSTWKGKSYFLEDIYIRPAYRGIGAGAHLFCEVVAIAKKLKCKRIDFHVLAWNPARKFYEKMGAIDMTQAEDWLFYRLEEQCIESLTQKLQNKI